MSHRFPALLAVIPLVAVLGGFQPAHADTKSVSVDATVKAVCKFSSGDVKLNFSDLDPSDPATTDVQKDVELKFKCTKGTKPTAVGLKNGAVTKLKLATDASGAKSIAYNLAVVGPASAYPAGLGFSDGNEVSVTLRGTIPRASIRDAEVGAYSDTVQFDINP